MWYPAITLHNCLLGTVTVSVVANQDGTSSVAHQNVVSCDHSAQLPSGNCHSFCCSQPRRHFISCTPECGILRSLCTTVFWELPQFLSSGNHVWPVEYVLISFFLVHPLFVTESYAKPANMVFLLWHLKVAAAAESDFFR